MKLQSKRVELKDRHEGLEEELRILEEIKEKNKLNNELLFEKIEKKTRKAPVIKIKLPHFKPVHQEKSKPIKIFNSEELMNEIAEEEQISNEINSQDINDRTED
jgi:hypothetical protein